MTETVRKCDLEERAKKWVEENYSNLNCGIQGIIKQSCIKFTTKETKLLSEHIIELQSDKGRLVDENNDLQKRLDSLQGFLDKDVEYDEYKKLIDENKELKELVKWFYDRYEFYGRDPKTWENKKRAEQFLGK